MNVVDTIARRADADRTRTGPHAANPLCYGARTPYERDLPIHRIFARQARETPHAVALVDDDGSMSYAQLERDSNRLARHLLSLGIRPGTSIGVAFERSRNLPLVFLAILKAGGAYVPLDATYPAERIAFIIADAAIPVVIVDRAVDTERGFGSTLVVDLGAAARAIECCADDELPVDVSAESTAYIMYTSGSTGRAKGVVVRHRGVVRLVRGVDYFASGPDQTFLQFAPAAFDASTFEIWGALLNGARLAIPRPGLLSIDELGATVERLGATTMWLTASIFAHVVEAGLPSMRGLRQLLTGGSAGSPQHMVRFLELYPACRLIAGYGPTENTTFSTTFDLSSPAAIGTNPPIGRPIANSSAYVLDDALALVPLGTIGELCVGGDGVAAGYLNLPNETAARFVPDPFALESGALMYRTGDRARMRVDGVIEFLGRTDDQVKINGFRIELGEIEAVLKTHPGVRDAAVVVVERSVGEKSLSAHVVPAVGVDIDEAALRGYLRAKLPAYLVPPRIAIRAALTLHPSGKIDRVALAQSATPVAAARPVAPPQAPSARPSPTQIKRVVSDIWSELLDEAVAPDPHTNFFDAGGDSIRLLRLQTLLNERLAANITVLDLFEFTTIERIATFVANGRR